MAHNEEEISANEFFQLLESISQFVEKKVTMYALGGTALTILQIKNSTRDVDINIESDSEYRYMCKIFDDLGFEKDGARWITQEGLAFDMFHGSNIMGTELLPDYTERSEYIQTFGNLRLYTLSLDDIIISKLARGDTRDFEDIRMVLEAKRIDFKQFIQRYKETMETSVVADYTRKLLDLIQIKCKEWGIAIDPRLIEEVKEWDHR